METSPFFTQDELAHVWHLTPAQIEGSNYDMNNIPYDSWTVRNYYRLMNERLCNFKDQDLKDMLIQNGVLQVIIPMVIKRMEVFFFEERNPNKPYLSAKELEAWGGEDYENMEGVLRAVVDYQADFWAEHPIELEQLKHIITRAVRLNLQILADFTYDKVKRISFDDRMILEVLYVIHNLNMIVDGFERHEVWNHAKPYHASGYIYLHRVFDEFITGLDAFYHRFNEIQFFNEQELDVISKISAFNYKYAKKLQRMILE